MSYPQLPLHEGSHGVAVRQVQNGLRARGHGIAADGRYGPGTAGAIRVFQRDHKLHVDGVTGRQVWDYMFPTLHQGSKWPGAIRALQHELDRRGYNVAHDGDFGPGIKHAVQEYQRHNHLPVDGIMGQKSWYVMFGGDLPMPSGDGGAVAQASLAIANAISLWEGGQGSDGLFHVRWDYYGRCWTIGYGYTIGVTSHTGPWTRQYAVNMLHWSLDHQFAPYVHAVGVPLNQKQFDALTSFIYNCGPGVIRAGTPVGGRLRARNYAGAADALLGYCYAGGVWRLGLARRRRWERQLFLGGTYAIAW